MRTSPIKRRKSRQIKVGKVFVGGDAPIAVQSMTNTLTSNAAVTIEQILRMEKVGVDIVRVSCPDEESTAALPEIIKNINVPLVADIHFHYQRGIEAADAGAACLRINPGNIGGQDRVREVVKAAKANGCAIRIGINGASLEKGLLEKYFCTKLSGFMIEKSPERSKSAETTFVMFSATGFATSDEARNVGIAIGIGSECAPDTSMRSSALV